jgi:hypothetical protein
MKIEISCGKPKDVGRNDLDGVMIRFPFTVREIGEGTSRDKVSEHRITVKISGTLLVVWGLGSRAHAANNLELIKTLFEVARRHVEVAVRAGNLKKDQQIDLHTANAPAENPYDPAKIPNPEDYTFEITLATRGPGKKLVWLSFDLGVKGDYDGLYAWLDSKGAKECGLALAVFTFVYEKELLSEIFHEIKGSVKLRQKTDRLYLIYLDTAANKMRGTYLFGKRKTARWKGYGPGLLFEEDSDAN